ncbi:hypothetical protein [Marinobacter fonticola]|uniref:hypothetical protein n=1 Tax=Marinobacter fonticola TaxID=2603215 RepID=UPI0011E7986E|nr:hypothetical protein [Marinobacter fonticola]
MDWILLLLVALSTATLGWAGIEMRRQQHRLGLLYRALVIVEDRERKQQFEFIEADNRRKLLQASVENGTSAVEIVHRVVTTTTFGAIDRLSRNERLRENNMRARELHDDATRNMYRSIRIANRQIHALANAIIGLNRKRRSGGGKDG